MTGVSGWIVTWRSSHELYVLHYFLQVLIERDTQQHNRIKKNSEMEMCMLKICCFVINNRKLLSLN